MNKNLMIVALVMAFGQVGFTAPIAAKSTAVQVRETRQSIDRKALEEVASKGKTAKEKRDLVIQAYGADASIKLAADVIQVDKTELLSHLATNPAAVDTVNYTVKVLNNKDASALDTRAALANSKVLRTIARNSALSAKDQADIAATRKMVVVGAYVAQYGEKAVQWLENVSKRTSEGVQANLAVRSAGKEILKLEDAALEKFMDSKDKDSFANCKL